MKNILFLVGKYPGFGGVETVTTVLANEFVRRGNNVVIVSFEITDPRSIQGSLSSQVKLQHLSYPVSKKENIKILREYICNNNTDIIINQWAIPYYVTRLINKARNGTKARLISVHHNQPDTNFRIEQARINLQQTTGLFKLFNRIKLEIINKVSSLSLRYVVGKNDRFIVLSPSFVPILSNFIKMNLSNVRAIGNPLTITPQQVEKKKKEIIVVGRIEFNQKRLLRVLDIWKKLSIEFKDWSLIFVGDGPDRGNLESAIKDMRLERIRLTGFVNPIPYYKDASIILMTSEYEGFGLVILEAMAHRVVPVVLDSYAALKDLVPDGYGIRLPYPFDVDKSVEIIRQLMQNPMKLQSMSNEAVKSPANFSIEKIADEWENLFKELEA